MKNFYNFNILKFCSFLSFIFFARPKKTNQKKGRPASRLILPVLPALSEVEGSLVEGRVAETGGPLPNSAPKQQGPQTAEGACPSGSCDARRGTTMGTSPWAQILVFYGF
jgi:hypothetical protein